MHDTQTRDGTTTQAARFDIYNLIHKALRLAYGDTLAKLGCADVDDPASLDAALGQALSLFGLLQSHYGHEDRFIHPALAHAQPGATLRIEAEHREHLASLDAMRELVEVVRASRGATRAGALARIYHALALYIAAAYDHMAFEDSEFNAMQARHYSDADLLAIDREIVATVEPAVMAVALPWIVAALNPGERAAFLGGARQGMPADVFAGVLAITRETLPSREWQKLAAALGV
jgi:predicted RNase H-like HicB family nuclease